jgi:translation elongation factor EF-Tu-like GTPase
MTAKFKTDSTFTVTGRGLVVAGEIMEGKIKVGMMARIPSWPQELRISGVEFIRRKDQKPCDIGLLFSSRDEAEYARWRALDLEAQILEIHDQTGETNHWSERGLTPAPLSSVVGRHHARIIR